MLKKSFATRLQYCLPQHWLSRAVGLLAQCQWAWIKNPFIRWFCKHYQVDLSECPRQTYQAYHSFNDFFTRHLNPQARSLAAASLICPVDGAVSECGWLTQGKLLQAKGVDFTIAALTGQAALNNVFTDGQFATLYLAPSNYHRVHMPLAGKLMWMTYIPGRLFSVNQRTAAEVPQLFCRNERLYCHFETAIGPVGIVMVGAMIVASIVTTWAGHIKPSRTPYTRHYDGQIVYQQGDELGWFELGSTVILLLPPGAPKLAASLKSGEKVQWGQALVHQENVNTCPFSTNPQNPSAKASGLSPAL